jgi:5-methylcytosine-specific restriction endonuclease McrA
MLEINKPTLKAGDVFEECVSRIRNPDLRTNLQSCTTFIEGSEILYESKAQIAELHKIKQKDHPTEVTLTQLKKVYKNNMQTAGQPGRKYYDQILASAPMGVCPFCSQRIASTIDHVLPKATYPNFAVVPINLVPCCKDCNTGKHEFIPSSSSEEHLHPYYDKVNHKKWLHAKIHETNPITVSFYVKPPNDWDSLIKSRILTHFKVFKLNKLYTTHAAVELMNLSYLKTFSIDGQEEIIKNILSRSAKGKKENNRNSWQTALYEALSASKWFYTEGVKLYR